MNLFHVRVQIHTCKLACTLACTMITIIIFDQIQLSEPGKTAVKHDSALNHVMVLPHITLINSTYFLSAHVLKGYRGKYKNKQLSELPMTSLSGLLKMTVVFVMQ